MAEPNINQTQPKFGDTTIRDQLAAVLHNEGIYCGDCDYESGECSKCDRMLASVADAILAAGWRPPARVIETAEDRDVLPAGTVIRDANGEFHCRDPYDSGTGTWFPAWLTGRAYAQDFGQAPQLPAVVVWEPEQEARQ